MNLGFIGTGVMGASMAQNLMNSGHTLHVYNRTKSKTDGLAKNGAIVHDTPKSVAENTEVIFSMVGYPRDVEEIYFGEFGIFQADVSGKIVVDHTTSEPALAVKIAKRAKELGAESLDAPVSGGDVGAKNATLTIMVGGEKFAFEKVAPLLEIVGKTVEYQGESGSGQHVKMANQIGVAGTMMSLVELLAYADAAHLDLEKVLKTLSGGGAYTWSLANYAPRILKEDYSPGFFVKHFIKDLGIALNEAEKMNLNLPSTALAKELYEKLAENGCENDGTQALMKLWWKDGKRENS